MTVDAVSLEDTARLVALLRAVGSPEAAVILMGVDGEPISKARPRFSSTGRVYNSQKQRDHADLLAWHFRLAVKKQLVGNLAVACIFYRSSHQRVDVDNMLKQVLDSANKIVWADDVQVTAVVGVIELDADHPRSVIGISAHESSLNRGNREQDWVCVTCGKSFRRLRYPSQPTPAYCSPICSGRGRRDPIACAECGVEFPRRTYGQKLCGETCRRAYLSRMRRVPRSVCIECAAPVSKSGYVRCRPCWRLRGSRTLD